MSKGFIYKMVLAASFFVVAIFYLLSVVMKDTFGFFNLSYAIAIFSFICGVTFILRGTFEKAIVVLKKFRITLGAGLIIIAFVSLIGALSIPGNYVLPIIACILTGALLISTVAVGGRKWDQGDNQNEGYKDYYQRKKEEEKNK